MDVCEFSTAHKKSFRKLLLLNYRKVKQLFHSSILREGYTMGMTIKVTVFSMTIEHCGGSSSNSKSHWTRFPKPWEWVGHWRLTGCSMQWLNNWLRFFLWGCSFRQNLEVFFIMGCGNLARWNQIDSKADKRSSSVVIQKVIVEIYSLFRLF